MWSGVISELRDHQPRWFGGNLLVGLVLLVILVAAPAFAILIDFQRNLAVEREAEAKTIAFQQVELINATMANLTQATREVMVTASAQGKLRRLEPACAQNLDRFRTRLPDYAVFVVLRLDGTVVCSSAPVALPDGALRDLGRPFLSATGFTVGRYFALPAPARPVLLFALPFSGADGAPAGVLVTGLDLRRLDALLAGTPRRHGGTMIIRDGDATVLARAPASAGIVGERSDGPDRTMMNQDASGATLLRDGSGQERVLGYVPVSLEPAGLFVSAGFDVDDLNSGIDRAARRGYILIAIGIGCSLLFALLFGNRTMRAPAAVLLSAAGRLGGGDLTARAAMPAGIASEFAALGRAFNAMAAMLQRQRMELQGLNEALELRVADRTRALLESNNRLQVAIAERELTESNLRQAQKLQAVGQLAGGIAHDFNNVLAVILGSLEVLGHRLAGNEAGAAALIDQAAASVGRGSRLTSQLLTFARKQPLLPVQADVAAVVGGMAELLASTLGPAVRLQVKVEDGVWPVMLDPNQFEAAILNLALNASAAMPKGGRMSVAAANAVAPVPAMDVPPGDYVRVTVSDSGVGMTAETMSRAFEPFFTTRQGGSGSGLGLSQVHGMVHQSGGAVAIDSRPGDGTVVTMLFPRSMAVPVPEPGIPHDPGRPALAADRLVLLVDDDAPVREVTALTLTENGYTVVVAADGFAALEVLEQDDGRIALVVADYAMPGMTGRELLETVRLRRPDVAVLLATGYADYPDLLGETLSLDQIVRKPFRAVELLTRIHRVCEIAAAAPTVSTAARPR